MKANVVFHADAPLQDLGGGVSRRVHGAAGGVGSVHTHPHCQNTYVQSGRFRFTVDGEAVEVGPGDTLAFPSGIPHGTLCLEAGTLLDIFTPMREDFVR